jgi:hypothetical protein
VDGFGVAGFRFPSPSRYHPIDSLPLFPGAIRVMRSFSLSDIVNMLLGFLVRLITPDHLRLVH